MRIFICLKQNVIYVCFSFCVMNVFVSVFVVCVCVRLVVHSWADKRHYWFRFHCNIANANKTLSDGNVKKISYLKVEF